MSVAGQLARSLTAWIKKRTIPVGEFWCVDLEHIDTSTAVRCGKYDFGIDTYFFPYSVSISVRTNVGKK